MADLPRRKGPAVGLCIALLVKHAPSAVVIDFVRYHMRIGFAHVYLFFDDPDDPVRKLVEHTDGVSAFACDAAFWRKRLRSSTMVQRRNENKVFDDTASHLKTEHKCRQNLCVELAIEQATASGMEWLLHIDIDELFLPQVKHPQDYFGELPSSVAQVYLANHEVAPEAFETDNWMRRTSRFKLNPIFAAEGAAQRAWEDVQAWRARVLPGTPRTTLFNAYSGGKSAVRLSCRPLPYDVHKFLVLAPFNMYIVPETHNPKLHTDPVVLHYANCGFEHWRRKYRNLGRFPDLWWDRVPIRLPVHLLSRDMIHGATDAEAAHFYTRVIMGNEAGEMDYLQQLGLVCCVRFVQSVLAHEPG